MAEFRLQTGVVSEHRLVSYPRNSPAAVYTQVKVDPAVQWVVRSQMNAVDSSQFREAPDLFDIEDTNSMPRASIDKDKLPQNRITEECNRNAVGDLSWFFVCLEDFQIGEKVRSLLDCWHVFIAGWLIKHGTCRRL